jgi:hypothetical protein
MRRAKWNFEQHRGRFRKLVPVAILLTSGILGNPALAQEQGQKTFSTPVEASEALYTAAKSNDEKELLEIFGPAGKEILYSGDEAEDAESRATFLQRYEEMHRLVEEPNGTVSLYIGARNWPAPIPIVRKQNGWYFDAEAGKQEILFRRIGRNEISAIQICRQVATAEKEFSQQNHEYARKVFSDEEKHNGLYWQMAGQPESPIGPLVATAVTEGASNYRGSAVPYRGYFFRVLAGQGKHAPCGAKTYIANNKMTGGFAFVAFPAEYRSSGVKTFLVSTDGVVFEKDLGENTEAIATSMRQFNPDSTWRRAEHDQE